MQINIPIEKLTWALVIPTYKREAVLRRCLGFAAAQTYPPKEIIVVDATPDGEQTQAYIMHELAVKYPTIDWQYLPAKRASSSAQRNQGIALATADIIFLIDDDSFMYPDCAEEVIRIYAQDTTHQVAGIMPKLEILQPDNQLHPCANHFKKNNANAFFQQFKILQIKLRAFAKRLIKDDDIFIPYDLTFPKYTLPNTLKHLATHPVPMIHGARMSFRRYILAQIHFEEALERYAVNEDNDVCYRASRLGMLLHALKARLCHVESSQGRLTRLTTTALWGLNQTVLHRFHSSNLVEFKKRFRKLLWHRLFTQTIKDILDRRWTLPSTRGIIVAFRHYESILSKTPAELRAWYPQFQQTLISQDKQEIINMANNDQNSRDLDQSTKEQVVTGLSLQSADESALENAEPWESWETKLVLWSILIGISGLVVLGTLINIFLLK